MRRFVGLVAAFYVLASCVLVFGCGGDDSTAGTSPDAAIADGTADGTVMTEGGADASDAGPNPDGGGEASACTSDGRSCTSHGACCSGACVGNTCAPLNATCKTIGNACTTSSDCCSLLCKSGTCAKPSFCGQNGDVCSNAADCCSGACALGDAGIGLGTCSPLATGASCGLTDGVLCAGTGDGGAATDDGGLPGCGGACCSQLCAPYAPTGVLVCMPASGCHVVGDVCTRDTDCCGSAGLPGGSGTPVTCAIPTGATVGVCRNPQGCKPDGDLCKLATMSCNVSCDCCSGQCNNVDTCHLDGTGTPRCSGLTCVAPGGACASSANCCNGVPCVPNDGGAPPYVCLSSGTCAAAGASCTFDGDCCAGNRCNVALGSASGTCAPGGACGLYGQSCATNADCCSGVPCTSSVGAACAGQTGCRCRFGS